MAPYFSNPLASSQAAPYANPMPKQTSWESSERWYDSLVGTGGHYYHQQVILPALLRLLAFHPGDSLLDLACGQGVLARALPEDVDYHGVDLAPSLIRSAKKSLPGRAFSVADITKPLKVGTFTHAAIVLALQNVENPLAVIQNAYRHLEPGGTFVCVLNHPCFRIPRQSHWGVDEAKKLQYRRIDAYLSPLKIPIQTHPGKGKTSPQTWSFHHPLSSYVGWLSEAGFVLTGLEEWASDKTSDGKHAKRENRARKEFPLFLTLKARKT